MDENIILLFAEDIMSRLLLLEMLLRFHYHILECDTAKDAIRLFNKHVQNIRLILIDLKYSDEDKWNILPHLRNDRFEIPAIAISAMEPKELDKKSKAAGFDNYISKPINHYEFQELIGFYLCSTFHRSSGR